MYSAGDMWVLKICSAGSYAVGKTSLIRRYAEDKFSLDYLPTIGVDITTKRVTINEHKIKLVLIDTAGQEYFGKVRKAYFEGAFGCIIVYDITRTETFEEVDRWISDFRSVVGEDAILTIIGNKVDLKESRSVTYKQGEEHAKKYAIPFYECSAKLGGDIISEIYRDLVNRYLIQLREKECIEID